MTGQVEGWILGSSAYSIARWLQHASITAEIEKAFAAPEPESVAMTGQVEGWILGSSMLASSSGLGVPPLRQLDERLQQPFTARSFLLAAPQQ
ncbi:hypothetical protein [Mycobacterium tuberculosis]|uniref:hypothetical protein n=1 Tax=Mycobacterium tuberculosis TaxID=1773 RepID=UPI00272BB87B|nr:hypothetical protein [Mycobacterium tuberculosis]